MHRLPRSGVERKLFSRKPVAQIRTLALDEGSRTSAALVRILLKERFALVPNVEALPIGVARRHDSRRGAVDWRSAINSPPGQFAEVWDLGDEWWRGKTSVCVRNVGRATWARGAES